ncbi:MAG TPA: AMP-binding protein [Caulobacteraceae bacterium]|jgi:long-chain acyl-CoA synthetase
MNPFVIARLHPDRPATINASTGEVMSYAALDEMSRRLAAGFRALGLQPGDHIALMVSNGLMFHPICWGAWLAGLYFTPISTRLRRDEVEHLITDSGSKLVIASPGFEDLMGDLKAALPGVGYWFLTAPGAGGLSSIDSLIADLRPLNLGPDELAGADMLYSSGTTGKPKGILPRLEQKRNDPNPLAMLLKRLYGFDQDTRYLTPAPLYHGSPLKFSMAIHRFGGVNIIMERFDAEEALAAIAGHGVTHSQWVPTMLHRMVRLPDEVKARHDLSSHRVAIHAAAPCPVELKRQIIDWWGPIVHEFYAGSEAVGFTAIDTPEWLERPGSVGRAVLGEIHIVGEAGAESPPGEVGQIYFGNAPKIAYHNDPAKTARAYHPSGWITLGDMGRIDDKGYLYLSDRKDFMIITGGVNVYPKEIEDVLVMHPSVEDAAVFGLPNTEFGEEVKAVVQPSTWPDDEVAFIEALTLYCREHLSSIKLPRSFDLARALPRQENGKLYKKALRETYLTAAGAQ